MSAVAVLRREHERVLRVLGIVAAVVERLARSREVPEEDLRGALRLLHDYVDRFHHAREEGVLFPALAVRGLSSAEDPLRELGEQHDRLRSLTTAMRCQLAGALARDPAAIETLALLTREHDALSRRHIDREERSLFPVVEERIAGAAATELTAALRRDEEQRASGWLAALADEEARLAAAYGVAVHAPGPVRK